MEIIAGLLLAILFPQIIYLFVRTSFFKSIWLSGFRIANKNNLKILLQFILVILVISFFLPFILIDGQSTSHFDLVLNKNYLMGLSLAFYITTVFLLFFQNIKYLKYSFFILGFGYLTYLTNGLIIEHRIQNRNDIFYLMLGEFYIISGFLSLIIYMQIFLPHYWTEEKFSTKGMEDAPVTKSDWIKVFKNIFFLFLLTFIVAIIVLFAIYFDIPKLLTNYEQ